MTRCSGWVQRARQRDDDDAQCEAGLKHSCRTELPSALTPEGPNPEAEPGRADSFATLP